MVIAITPNIILGNLARRRALMRAAYDDILASFALKLTSASSGRF
jgi:hypothetical protein